MMKEYVKPLLEVEEYYVADTAIASGEKCWMCAGGGVSEEEVRAAGYSGEIVPPPFGCGLSTGKVECVEIIK